MYFPGDVPSECELLLEQYQRCLIALTPSLAEPEKVIEIFPGTNCNALPTPNQVLRIKEGYINAGWQERTAFILQENDFIFLPAASAPSDFHYLADDRCTLEFYDIPQLINPNNSQDSAQQWLKALLCMNALLSHMLAYSSRGSIRPQAGFLRFQHGDTIIEEGDQDNEVFTLMKGAAEVSLNGVTMGMIEEGEVFGALSVLTGEPRSATVRAASSCTVMAIPGAQFLDLLHSQPQTGVQLLGTLAKRLNQLSRAYITLSDRQRLRPVK